MVIPKGTSTSGIGAVLEQAGVISNATVFTFYVGRKHAGPFEAGRFVLRKNSDFDSVDHGARGRARSRRPFMRVNIPEGLTVAQIEARAPPSSAAVHPGADQRHVAERRGPVDAAAAPARRRGKACSSRPPTTSGPAPSCRPCSTTWRPRWRQVTTRAGLDPGERPPSRRSTASRSPPYEVLIVASLIQQEAGNAAEAPMIATVIYNRLQRRRRARHRRHVRLVGRGHRNRASTSRARRRTTPAATRACRRPRSPRPARRPSTPRCTRPTVRGSTTSSRAPKAHVRDDATISSSQAKRICKARRSRAADDARPARRRWPRSSARRSVTPSRRCCTTRRSRRPDSTGCSSRFDVPAGRGEPRRSRPCATWASAGLSVTMPHKGDAAAAVDRLTPGRRGARRGQLRRLGRRRARRPQHRRGRLPRRAPARGRRRARPAGGWSCSARAARPAPSSGRWPVPAPPRSWWSTARRAAVRRRPPWPAPSAGSGTLADVAAADLVVNATSVGMGEPGGDDLPVPAALCTSATRSWSTWCTNRSSPRS